MKKKVEKLYFLPYDGTFDGDNIFYCPDNHYPYKDGMSLNDMKEAIRQQGNKDGEYLTDEEINENIKEALAKGWLKKPLSMKERSSYGGLANSMIAEIKGAWIVDKKGLSALFKLVDSMDPRGDSLTYACNRAAKSMADSICIKRVGKKPH